LDGWRFRTEPGFNNSQLPSPMQLGVTHLRINLTSQQSE
jgi:hypothetical protein